MTTQPPLPQGWRSREFELPDVRLHCIEAGPDDGPLVVLLHGFPEFWRGWSRQIDPLAKAGYRVVVPDQRGYNLSSKPRPVSAYGLDQLVADVVNLIDACGAETCYLAGHDWGGVVAWWVAVTRPSRLRGVSILNAPHPLVMRKHILKNPAQRKRSSYVFLFQLPWLPERRLSRGNAALLKRALAGTSKPGTFDETEIAQYVAAWQQPDAVRSMLNWYRAGLRYPPKRVDDIKVHVPMKLIWGEQDRFLGKQLALDSLELCTAAHEPSFLPATHWVQHEEAERVGELILGVAGG